MSKSEHEQTEYPERSLHKSSNKGKKSTAERERPIHPRLNLLMDILNAALSSVEPASAVRKNLQLHGEELTICNERIRISDYRMVHVLGAGKGAPFLYQGLKEVEGLKQWISGGVVVSIEAHAFTDKKVKFMPGSHPIPDERSLMAGKTLLDYVEKNVRDNDLVFFLITGGASYVS